MFAIKITYLVGRAIATCFDDRKIAEWPPHPARFYSALVATYFDDERQDPTTRAALEWLAAQPSPELHVSEATRRDVVPVYVPYNESAVLNIFADDRDTLEKLNQEISHAKDDKTLKKLTSERDKVEKKLREKLTKDQEPFPKVDDLKIKRGRSLLPGSRNRQPRHFPSVTPLESHLFYIWPDVPAPELREALAVLLAKVVRLGHSSSLVTCCIAEAPTPNLVPADDGPTVLRVPLPDQLVQLERAFERHQALEPRQLPARYQRYTRPKKAGEPEPMQGALSDEWIVFRRVGGPRFPNTRAVDIAQTFRRALIRYAAEPVHPVISGHRPNGEPATEPHMAVVPLPFVGHPHADGAVLGLAVILPRQISSDGRKALYQAIGNWENSVNSDPSDEAPTLKLVMGRAGELELERVGDDKVQQNLRPEKWCGPARVWATATPIALDHNPGDLYHQDPAKAEAAMVAAEKIIADSCERQGLPRPQVTLLPSVTFVGTEKARNFPPFPPKEGALRRVKVHAELFFTEPVRGPLVLGAGRYLGLGLCRPGENV